MHDIEGKLAQLSLVRQFMTTEFSTCTALYQSQDKAQDALQSFGAPFNFFSFVKISILLQFSDNEVNDNQWPQQNFKCIRAHQYNEYVVNMTMPRIMTGFKINTFRTSVMISAFNMYP
jgi:hypothetical protein